MSLRFVVQEHHASRLHYDFRLERDGVLKSWAVPKGPSMDPSQKHLAMAVDDHDLEYADYEGIIPAGGYGAGAVVTWDKGTYEVTDWKPREIVFKLYGDKLRGGFALVRLSKGKETEWLLLKMKDADAVPGWKLERALTDERKASLRECAPPRARPRDMNDKPRIGISTCLLGEKVRYDGQHSQDHFLTDTFGKFVEWVPVCPEVECGLGIPREPMHLEGDPDDPTLVTIRTHQDLTGRMKAWARARVRELDKEDLAGYIFKSGSPSSGMERVKVYGSSGVPRKIGVGLFAKAFMDHFPLLPVEEEGRLHDDVLRETFIESVFCLKRYRDAVRRPRTRGALVAFHAAHKLVLMAHSPKHLKEMGALVARGKELAPKELLEAYERLLVAALRTHATAGKNTNVLMHAMGYFKEDLSAGEKKEMLEVIEDYRREFVPLVVPVTLLRHYVRKYDQPYLREQAFLNPHPIELKLRNHA